ncbi:amiloride-sensitive sodium channel subunit gamma-2 [Trichonephila clavata]|uniref:Amiloride-sensitive sodium channel subunit gamma-2 n=1 Tax=Trichonephila clavata TaxID=2740835 RepID=A0A8X6FJ20_TRICU|nr:amiloride-sensitive sodium channel subunit gamma-2 [Trichonephila clavata]
MLQKISISLIFRQCSKFSWLFIWLAASLGCIWKTSVFLNDFFQYPVIVNLKVEKLKYLEFPAITICNLNRVKAFHTQCLNLSIPLDVCLFSGEAPLDPFRNEGPLVMSERRSIFSCSSALSRKYDNKTDMLIRFLSRYILMDKDRRKRIGHTAEQLISKCMFNGMRCSSRDFEDFHSLRYGNCFTFNKGKKFKAINTSTGPLGGLTLEFNVEFPQYFLQTEIGARISIHNPEDYPELEENGINIPPGYETSIALRQIQIRRLPSPYKDECVDYSTNFATYGSNQKECMKACMQAKSYAACGCVDPTLPSLPEQKVCDMSSDRDMCCLNNAIDSMISSGYSCECPLPCLSTNYQDTTSKSFFPSWDFLLFVYKMSGQYSRKDYLGRFAWNFYRGSFGKVNIYYSSMDKMIFEQKSVYQDAELYSYLGGELGFWLGLSFCSLFHLISILFTLFNTGSAN